MQPNRLCWKCRRVVEMLSKRICQSWKYRLYYYCGTMAISNCVQVQSNCKIGRPKVKSKAIRLRPIVGRLRFRQSKSKNPMFSCNMPGTHSLYIITTSIQQWPPKDILHNNIMHLHMLHFTWALFTSNIPLRAAEP